LEGVGSPATLGIILGMRDTLPVHPLPPIERLEQLVIATSSLITEVSLDGVLQRVVEVAAEVIGAQYAAIGVLAPDGRLLESFTTQGIDADPLPAATASWAW
jgi:GAF domain-containing protein